MEGAGSVEGFPQNSPRLLVGRSVTRWRVRRFLTWLGGFDSFCWRLGGGSEIFERDWSFVSELVCVVIDQAATLDNVLEVVCSEKCDVFLLCEI